MPKRDLAQVQFDKTEPEAPFQLAALIARSKWQCIRYGVGSWDLFILVMGTPEEAASNLGQISHWPFVPILTRLGIAVAIGLFIGLEREHSGKNGVRTFALTALLGCLGRSYGGLLFRDSIGLCGDDSGVDELPTNGVAESVSLNDLHRINVNGFWSVDLAKSSNSNTCAA